MKFIPLSNIRLKFFYSFFAIIISSNIYSQQLAFPTAYGAGAYATGGRGGEVVHVTNLNDSGTGSLREAMSMTVPRTIVFDVSGVIQLNSILAIGAANSNLTIAGQTAPEGGITIDGGRVYFGFVDNVIVRHIRFKGGLSADTNIWNDDNLGNDSFSAAGSITNQIFDHCSFAFGVDECASWYATGDGQNVNDVTVQNCLFAENVKGSIIGKQSGTSGAAPTISFIGNLFYNSGYRFPNIAGDNGRIDIFNNIVWNADGRLIRGNGSFKLNQIGNYYNYGSTLLSDTSLNVFFFGTIPEIFIENNEIVAPNTSDYGLTSLVSEMNNNNKLSWKFFLDGGGYNYGDQLPSNYFVDTQHEILGRPVDLLTGNQTLIQTASDVGCNSRLNANGSVSDNTDVLDANWLNAVNNEIFTNKLSQSEYVVPAINSIERPDNFYVSNPHIPEIWFNNNVPDGQDHNSYAPSGYTWLEEYLNQVDGPTVTIALENVEITPEAVTLNIPETITLTTEFTPVDASNLNGTWSSSNESIATVTAEGIVNSISEGEATITFVSEDGNFTDTSIVTVTNIIIPIESITITPNPVQLDINESIQLNVEITPSNATFTNGTWISNNENVCTVDENGLVTALAEGEAEITFVTEDGQFSESIFINVVDVFYGSYILYNAISDEIIQNIEGDEAINLADEGNQINFRCIPQGGDDNPAVESIVVTWTGPTSGTWTESVPLYAGLPGGHVDLNFEPYVVEEGTYNFTVKYYSLNAAAGDVVAVDNFSLSFFFNVLPVADAGLDQVICEGDIAELTASGGPYFLWDNGETTPTISVSPEVTTTYSVTVFDDNGNESTDSVIVSVINIPIVTLTENLTICEGDSVTLTVSGGSSYLWDTGETSESIIVNPLFDTVYSVEVFSDNNCSSVGTVSVFVNEVLDINISNDIVIVLGESVTLTAEGSDNYLWSTSDTSPSIVVSPEETTVYEVTSLNDNGCISTSEVVVTVVPPVIANAGEDVTICNGESVDLFATGGVLYDWGGGISADSLHTVAPNSTTTYSVTVTDDYGHMDTDTVTVFVNESPNLIIDDDIFIMIGQSATLNVNGGDTYLWNTGETTSSITVQPYVTTLYTVTGNLENGCEQTVDVLVTVVEELNANAGEDISICLGDAVTLIAEGGITYSWDTGVNSAILEVYPNETTTYTVTVGDAYGNIDTDDVTVIVNPIPAANAGENQTICEGETVTLTATGGDSYLWSNGATTQTIEVNPLEDTTYTVDVHLNNCVDTDSVTVYTLETPELTISENEVIVIGEAIELSVNGGDSYLWNTGETTSNILVSPEETTTYFVTGYNEHGCESVLDVTVTVIPGVVAYAGEDVEICIGENINLSASGGQTYLWNTGDTGANQNYSPTETTTYIVTVTDAYGYSDTDSVTVTVNENPNLSITEDLLIVEGQSANLSINGAESYLWNTGEVTNSIIVSPSETTTYSVTGYSMNGCSDTISVVVTVIPEVIAYAGEDVVICEGESVTLTASGGMYYSWSTVETGNSIIVQPSETTTYSVSVSDAYGNIDTDTVTVIVNESPQINVNNDVYIIAGMNATLSVSGADEYLWSTGETTSSIVVNPMETSIFTVVGISNVGCQSIEREIVVNIVPEVVADAGEDVAICIGESITLSASGGSDFLWSTGETGASIIVSPDDTTLYSVTVMDEYGNSDSDDVIVNVNAIPIIYVSDDITIVEGENTILQADGAVSYVWSTGDTSSSVNVSPSETTTYTVYGISNSCVSNEKEIVVTVIPLFVASAGLDERVCDNLNYEVVLTASEGDSYLWSTGETSQSIVVSPMATTTYHVTITQGIQEDSDSVTVYVDPSPQVVIENGESVDIMSGDFITLSASGANSYEWNNGATQPNIAVSPSETTTYEVRGYIGDCYDDKQVTVNVHHPVEAEAGEDVSICLEDVVLLTATGGDEYLWSTGETTATIEVSPLVTTDYTVTVFNALDFDEDTVTVEVDLNCSIQNDDPTNSNTEAVSLTVFPNPALNEVNVKLTGVYEVSYVYFYDVTGKLVNKIEIFNEDLNPSTTTTIDISSFQSGIYFVKFIDNGKKDFTKKLIVN
ncbi:Ig-like domain-containing protein [Winogradskyella endarachnes]|nr:Ig-like domain-containing protein [Winogradskyella endarachnes]